MGYKKIENLYKNQTILGFKECFAMEKVHGTSAHISYTAETEKITYYSGGSSHMLFIELFNHEELLAKFKEKMHDKVIIYGEAYGGKCQGMSKYYGKNLQFVAFEVKVGDIWLRVPSAKDYCLFLNIPFMPYEQIPCTIEAIDKERDRDSVIGKLRTGKDGIIREGVVLRPISEFIHQGDKGGVIRVKHKRDEFKETTRTRKVIDPEQQLVLTKANDIAEEWVTEMRLVHVLDKLPNVVDMTSTKLVMDAMIEDILIEAKDEIVESKEANKAICNRTARLLKQYFVDKLNNESS